MRPDAGDVIQGSGGCPKVRWSREGKGKRSGVRVIYYNRLTNGKIWGPGASYLSSSSIDCFGRKVIPVSLTRCICRSSYVDKSRGGVSP